jgi:hypothetical protein
MAPCHAHTLALQVLVSLNGQMVAEDLPFNLFLCEMLKLLVQLIRFGYYVHKDDIAELVKPLASMLDGTNDLPERSRKVCICASMCFVRD